MIYHHILVHANDAAVDRNEGDETPGAVHMPSVENIVTVRSL